MMKNHKIYFVMMIVLKLIMFLTLWGLIGIWVLNGSPASVMAQTGLQRARVERMSKDALIIITNPASPFFAQSVSELQIVLPLWRETQTALVTGSQTLGLPIHPPADILLLMNETQPDFIALSSALQDIYNNATNPSARMSIQLQIVLAHESPYYYGISQVSSLWQLKIDNAFMFLYWLEVGTLAILTTLTIFNSIIQFRWCK